MHERQDRKTVRHPAVRRVDVDCEVLVIPEHGWRLVVLSAPNGTPDCDALRLRGVVGLQDLSAG